MFSNPAMSRPARNPVGWTWSSWRLRNLDDRTYLAMDGDALNENLTESSDGLFSAPGSHAVIR